MKSHLTFLNKMPFRLSSILCSLKSPLKAWNHLRIPQLVLLAWNHLKEVYLMITLDASTVIKYHGNWMWKQFVIEFYNCIMCRLRLNLFNRQQNVILWFQSSFLFNVTFHFIGLNMKLTLFLFFFARFCLGLAVVFRVPSDEVIFSRIFVHGIG